MRCGIKTVLTLSCAFGWIGGRAFGFDVQLAAPNSIDNLFIDGKTKPAVELSVTKLGADEKVSSVHLTATDLWGKPVAWDQTPDSLEQPIGMAVGLGFYTVKADVKTNQNSSSGTIEIGVIPAPATGLRKESFFASNVYLTGKAADFLQAIGMKIERNHWAPSYPRGYKVPEQPNGALAIDYKSRDADFQNIVAHDLWPLPIIGYSFEGALCPLAVQLGMHGPPRDNKEFIDTWANILKHYPEIETVEFWNEPWIFGWTWAADGATFRALQKQWCEMALKVHPGLRIIAGNSAMFTQDHVEIDPSCYKGLLSGTTNHPYSASTGYATFRAGDQEREMDFDAGLAREMGLPYHYLTEGGTEYLTPDPEREKLQKQHDAVADITRNTPDDQKKSEKYVAAVAETKRIDAILKSMPNASNNNQNAYKVVQYYCHAALAGCFMGNAQIDIGYGPTWTKANVTFATMTHFLEDRPIVADIWPSNELIWGGVFANPKFVNDAVKALPRASEINSRWNVAIPPEKQSDNTKVAVIWSNTGKSNAEVDTEGTLAIDEPGDIHAFDCTGREIAKTGEALVVPFTEYPVYLTSERLDVVALRSKVADARIEHVTPLNVYALSLAHPVDQQQMLVVRIENQLNREVKGKLGASLANQPFDHLPPQVDFTVPASKLIEVSIPWEAATANDTNQYAIKISADTDAGTVKRLQPINSSHFVKKTIAVDGSLDDWKGITPITLDSNQFKSEGDLSQYLLNPGSQKPDISGPTPRIVNQVYTAYDDDNVYLAAAVHEATFKCTAGQPVVKGRTAIKVTLPYESGEPDGLNHIRNCGDAFIFAFGFRDRVPNHGRQMDDPYEWKGHFYDVDNQYAVNMSTHGAQLTRICSPDGVRTTPYQTEKVPGVGPVDGAKVVIKRDEATQITTYELSIPRKELSLFDPSKGRLRFGFIASNSEQVGTGSALEYSRGMGVFDHWNCGGSFSPYYAQSLPCQTFSGIDP